MLAAFRTMKRPRCATAILLLSAGTSTSSMITFASQSANSSGGGHSFVAAFATEGCRGGTFESWNRRWCSKWPISNANGHRHRYVRTYAKGSDEPEGVDKLCSTRTDILNERLSVLGIDPVRLASAAQRSIVDPSSGYDPYFGKSAIRAYRTFINPKGVGKSTEVEKEKLEATASSIARQIEHLAKWHRSREARWVRHKDSESDPLESDAESSVGEDARTRKRTFPLVLILDNLRSSHNVGSLFRTADACACREVITCGITPHPGGGGADKVAKAALGAERTVPTRHFASVAEAVEALRVETTAAPAAGAAAARGVKEGCDEGGGRWYVAALETTAVSVCYTSAPLPGPPPHDIEEYSGTALILGNEVTGVDPDILPDLDGVIEIPMFGAKNSLNVAACAPVVMFEALHRWGALGRDEVVDGTGNGKNDEVIDEVSQ